MNQANLASPGIYDQGRQGQEGLPHKKDWQGNQLAWVQNNKQAENRYLKTASLSSVSRAGCPDTSMTKASEYVLKLHIYSRATPARVLSGVPVSVSVAL